MKGRAGRGRGGSGHRLVPDGCVVNTAPPPCTFQSVCLSHNKHIKSCLRHPTALLPASPSPLCYAPTPPHNISTTVTTPADTPATTNTSIDTAMHTICLYDVHATRVAPTHHGDLRVRGQPPAHSLEVAVAQRTAHLTGAERRAREHVSEAMRESIQVG